MSREQTIQAGAKASYESAYHIYTWEDAPAGLRQGYLDDAAVHYDAMEPLIRQAVAEELAETFVGVDAAAVHDEEVITRRWREIRQLITAKHATTT